MQVLIANEQKTTKLNIKKIGALTKQILKILRLPSSSSLSITFLSRARIRGLNRRYFKRDGLTDVITFGYKSRARPARMHEPYQNYLGDIIICPSVALENSRIYHTDFFEEITLYIIHGILHLQGYTDTAGSQKLKMQKKENQILKKLK